MQYQARLLLACAFQVRPIPSRPSKTHLICVDNEVFHLWPFKSFQMPRVGKGPSRAMGASLAVLCLHLNLICLPLLLSQLEMGISLTYTAPLTDTAFLVSTISHPLIDRRYHTIIASTAFLSVYHQLFPPSPWALRERERQANPSDSACEMGRWMSQLLCNDSSGECCTAFLSVYRRSAHMCHTEAAEGPWLLRKAPRGDKAEGRRGGFPQVPTQGTY